MTLPQPGPVPPGADDATLARLRREYTTTGLEPTDLAADPITQFGVWFDQAVTAGITEPNAMVLATVDSHGRPRQRTVLLKHVDTAGFQFFTNHESAKGHDIAGNPEVNLLFGWYGLHRQVIVSGAAHRVPAARSAQYFATRPRGSQLAAWASPQSAPIPDRATVDDAYRRARDRFPDEVPRPTHWGGYVVVPREVEFWQGRHNRLHDRLRFHRSEQDTWVVQRLAP